MICRRRALGDDVAAVHAGARAHVDDVVGGEDGVAVVLDDEHRVAEIAQPLQRLEQARVVALVQADRRLVEDVEHADQARADLRRQPDALRLAAGEGGRGAVEGQVVEPDVASGSRAARRSPSGCGARSLPPGGVSGSAEKNAQRLLDRQRRHLGDGLAVQRAPPAPRASSRAPLQVGHGRTLMKRSSSSRTHSDSVSL